MGSRSKLTTAVLTLGALVLTATLAFGVSGALAQSEVDPPTTEEIPESSGFEDEDGNPISQEEFEQIQEDETGLQWGNIALVVVVLLVVGAGIAWFVRSRRTT